MFDYYNLKEKKKEKNWFHLSALKPTELEIVVIIPLSFLLLLLYNIKWMQIVH